MLLTALEKNLYQLLKNAKKVVWDQSDNRSVSSNSNFDLFTFLLRAEKTESNKTFCKSYNFNWTRRTHLKSWIKLVSNRPIFNSCPIQMGNRVRQIWKSNQFHENYGETVKTEVPVSRRFDEFFLPSFFAKSKKMENCKSFVGGLFLKCYIFWNFFWLMWFLEF